MIIQYCSDLHLEFPENKKFLIKNSIIPVGEILILAGDIVPFRVMHEHNDFWDYISSNFENVYWIPGNHEYYYADIKARSGSFVEKIRDNVLLVNNTSIIHDDTKIIFTTLWTAISESKKFLIQQGLSDFKVIRNNGKLLIPDDYNLMHKLCLQYLNHELLDSKLGKTIVITHHVPTMLNYPEKYLGSYLNEAFAVELHDLILDSDIDYWIFGHHHQNRCDFTIGKTRMLSSQLGYVQLGEHKDFSAEQYFYV